jgi:Family of unknown function (DUF6448)
MPPHCDSLDGPVVSAARMALATGEVELILPYVQAENETELRDAFDQVMKVRALGPEALDVADRWFFETAVRVHRAGEGAAFTGLKPAGLDVGPVIPAAERALETAQAEGLTDVLCRIVEDQVAYRHAHAIALKAHSAEGVPQERAYVDAMLGLQVWAHSVYKQAMSDVHVHLVEHARG